MKKYFILADIAGNFIEFQKLLARIPKDVQIIVLGDVNDKGKYSAQIIKFLKENPQIIWIMGNHEHMMYKCYDFLTSGTKIKYDPFYWAFRNGGYKTLQSYGLAKEIPEEYGSYRHLKSLISKDKTNDTMNMIKVDPRMREIVEQIKNLPVEDINYIKSLPLKYEDENIFCSHAPMVDSNTSHLFFDLQKMDEKEQFLDYGALWNRKKPKRPRKDGKFFVYGHMNEEKVYCHTKKHPNGQKSDHVLYETFGICFDLAANGLKLAGLLYPEMEILTEDLTDDND